VTEQGPLRLGEAVRLLRQKAGLTIEQLAARAHVAERTISKLELGGNSETRPTTVAKLAEGLGLGEQGRIWLWAIARGEPVPSGFLAPNVAAPPCELPPDIGPFVGRSRELGKLTGETAGGDVVAVHVITGMGGIGKTALAIHAAHKVADQFPDGQFFLRLGAHTPGEQPIGSADALASLLQAAGAGGQQIPAHLNDRARLWRSWLAGKRVLLLLDDAIDSEQVQPLLPGTGGSVVLITSRGKLTALRGARQILLDVFSIGESAELLVQLAGRPELDRSDSAIEEIARLCDNLPLALGMLGSQLHCNPALTPDGLATELAQARDLPEEIHAEQATVGTALDLSYRDLTGDQQRMFRRLGLHPGADIDALAAAALDDTSPAEARLRLRALCDQSVITEPSYSRFRVHDLIRALAERRAVAEDPVQEREATVIRLLDYYVCATAAADRHLARRAPARRAEAARSAPTHVPKMPDRERAVSWMTSERLNLAAATVYAAGNGYLSYAVALPAAMHGFLRSHGYWDQALALHQTALKAAGQAGDLPGEAGALTDLGDVQYLTGDHAAAEISLTRALELGRQLGDPCAEAGALVELGILQQNTGNLASAEESLSRALDLSRSQGDQLGEANALNNLGAVQFMASEFTAAGDSQKRALTIYRGLGDQLGEASALNGLGGVQQAIGNYADAAISLTRAMELYGSLGDRIGEAYATGNLGAVQCIMGDWTAASGNLGKALDLYRKLGSRSGKADMRTNLAVLHRQTGDYDAAAIKLSKAIRAYRDLKDPFGEADALRELGVVRHKTGDYRAAAASLTRAVKLAQHVGERVIESEALNNLGDVYVDAAHDAYAQALDTAARIGVPLEQARAQEGTGRLLLQSGDRAAGMAMLERSLALYKQIGSANADRVAKILGL
jgi:tetratricopeptide (TPR) repeat protein/transcriptional regulator with XRE-family HTH domain